MNTPTTFEERVKQRIRDNFMDLIPDEQLQALVNTQIMHFNSVELPKMIKEEITAQYKAAIKAELEKPEYQKTWTDGGRWACSEMVTKLITENASEMLASMMGGMVQQVVYTMQQQSGIVPRY